MKKVCQRVREQIPELVSGALGPEKAGELRQHIGACPTCSEYLRCLKADDKQLRDYVEGMQSTLARLEDGVIEALGREPSREPIGLLSIWKTLRKSTTAKIAAAAVIIIVALIGVEVLIGPHEQPARKVTEDGRIPAGPPSTVAKHVKPEDEYGAYPADAEVRVGKDERLTLAGEPESGVVRVEEMIAAGDIEGLAAMLDGGEVESRMMAAYYLAIIGEPRGTAVLKELLPVYIAGDPNRITVLANFAQGLSVDKKEVSERWTAERLGDDKDRGAQRLEGKDVLVRLYRDWRTEPAVFETVAVEVSEGSVNFDSIKFGPNEVGETVVAVFGEDQTDVNVSEAVGDSIYAEPYKKGLRFSLPVGQFRGKEGFRVAFHDAFDANAPIRVVDYDWSGRGGRTGMVGAKPIPEAEVEMFLRSHDAPVPRIQLGKYSLDEKGTLTVPSTRGSLNRFDFIVSHPEYGTAREVSTALHESTTVFLPLVQRDSVAARRAAWGTIVDPEGNPVAGATIKCGTVRTLGEGLIDSLNAWCGVISDANGFFTFYVPNKRRHDERGLLIPPKSEYYLVINAPQEYGVLPYLGWVMNGQETTIIMERGDYFRTFVFEDDSGRITDPARLKATGIYIEREGKERLTFAYGAWKDGGRFPLGTYGARSYARGVETEFEPLQVTEDSPQELVFRVSESVVYHGRVINGLTGEPMQGAFVIGIRGPNYGNLSHITSEQWEVLHGLPNDPCLGGGALEPVNRIYAFTGVVRSDEAGRFEISFRPGAEFYAFVAFEENYLGVMHRKHALHVDESRRAEVPVIKLYPAAKVIIEPNIGAEHVYSSLEWIGISLRWIIDRDENPDWVKEFLATDDRKQRFFAYGNWLRANELQTFHVPAGLNLRVRLEAPSDDQWCPVIFDETINLAQGEVLDLGRVTFQPALEVSVKVVNAAGEPIEGVPVRKRVGDGAWSGPYNSDDKGVARFNVCLYTEGEFGVHYKGEGDLDLRETLPYEIAGPNDANSVYTFQVSDEMLDRLFE